MIDDEKVRDYCYITGKYRAPAHWSCNVNLKLTQKVFIIFHNLKGYGSHLIMNLINEFDVNVSVMPNGLEECIAFTINENLVFIGSKEFMNSSLEELAKKLSDNNFKYLSEEFNPEQIKLVKEKGVYPYEYIDSFERFSEDKLPDKKHFYKSLKNKHISEKDYLHAVKIWNNFEMKNMGDYHVLYLKTDVLLLADAFEKFINRSLEF